MPDSKVDRTFNRFANGAFLVVVAMTLAMALASSQFAPTSGKALLFYALLVAYTAAGIWGNCGILGRVPQVLEWVYFGAQLAFFALLVHFRMPSGAIWLLTMPIVSQAATRLPWPVLVVYGVAFLAINSWLPEALDWGTADRWRTALSLSSAYVFVVAMTMVMDSAHKARERAESLASELEAANVQLRATANQAAELAAATERNRIARDIHDGLGHYLTVVAVQTEAARALLPAQPDRAAEALAKAEQSARAALSDVRRSVGALRDTAARLPLRAALDGLVRESGLAATFTCVGEERRSSDAAEQALFRVAQEGLTNARKHAGPARVAVTLDYGGASMIAVEVADDGRGAPAASESGYGLVGLRERLAAVGGSVVASTRPHGGFLLRAEVPA
jgi:signal transduction histidine kinase